MTGAVSSHRLNVHRRKEFGFISFFFTMQAFTVSSDSSTKWKEEQNKPLEWVSLKTTAGKMSTQLSVWLHKTQTVTTKMTVFVRSTKATVTNTLLLLLLLLLLLCCCCSFYCVPIWTLKGLHDICNCTLINEFRRVRAATRSLRRIDHHFWRVDTVWQEARRGWR